MLSIRDWSSTVSVISTAFNRIKIPIQSITYSNTFWVALNRRTLYCFKYRIGQCVLCIGNKTLCSCMPCSGISVFTEHFSFYLDDSFSKCTFSFKDWICLRHRISIKVTVKVIPWMDSDSDCIQNIFKWKWKSKLIGRGSGSLFCYLNILVLTDDV